MLICIAFLRLKIKEIDRRKNIDIRIEMLKSNIKVNQLARTLKITRPSLSRKLRYELSLKEKEKILSIIKELKKGESQGKRKTIL